METTTTTKGRLRATGLLLLLAASQAFGQAPQPPATCMLADGTNGTAIATGPNSFACGPNAVAGIGSMAFGPNAFAGENGALAIGPNATAGGSGTVVIGPNSGSNSSNTTIVGAGSSGLGQTTLVGNDITSTGTSTVGMGRGLTLGGNNAVGVGNAVRLSADNAAGFGHLVRVSATYGSAFGTQANVEGLNGSAFGATAQVLFGADSAAAFGFGSIADRSNAVSFGNAALQRQLIYVAAGTADTDGVNVAQLKDLMQAFGGGANFNGGIFGAPNFLFASGDSFDNVYDALLYLDGRITRISLTPGPQGPQGPAGPTGPTGPTGPQGPAGTGGTADCDVAVCYDDSTRRTATLNEGGGATRLQNVDAGVRDTDAVNLGQMRAADLEVLNQANTYTDNRISNIMTVIDDRFEDIDTRLDRMGAMNTAMTMMASSAAGVSDQNRVAVGVGASGGEKAIAAGYQRAFSNGAVATFGVSYADGETSAGFGFGFGF